MDHYDCILIERLVGLQADLIPGAPDRNPAFLSVDRGSDVPEVLFVHLALVRVEHATLGYGLD